MREALLRGSAMKVLAIDPGPTESAWLIYHSETGEIGPRGKDPNAGVLSTIKAYCGRRTATDAHALVIEKVQSFGMAVGADIFEAVFWTGQFFQAWEEDRSEWQKHADRIGRIQIKNHLCHSSRAKDSNIRQALIDRFGPPGTKKNPGKTYGISKDLWSALAVAVTYADLNGGT